MRPNWLINQLPAGMLDDDFFVRFLSIFQGVADTLVAHPEQMEHLLDPAVTPEPMLRFIGRWLGIESLDAATPLPVQRRMVAETGRLIGWRGTRRGLLHALELLTGQPAEVRDNGGVHREGQAQAASLPGLRPATAPHVEISVVSAGWTTPEHLVALITEELPASVTFELWVGGVRLWPAPAHPVTSPAALHGA